MSRLLEGVFVFGCAVVGLSMGAPQDTRLQDSVEFSVRLIANAQDNLVSSTTQLQKSLCNAPAQLLPGLRHY